MSRRRLAFPLGQTADGKPLMAPAQGHCSGNHKGLKAAAMSALKEGGHGIIQSLEEIIADDDFLGDVVGKKALKNVRLAFKSWKAMQ